MQNGQTFGIWSDDPFRANQSKRVKSVGTGPFRSDQINPTEPAQTVPSWSDRYKADKARFWAVVAELGQG